MAGVRYGRDDATLRCGCMKSGLIKSNPKKIIAEKTDWRFFNELNRALKANE